jgi:hypothetical protein
MPDASGYRFLGKRFFRAWARRSLRLYLSAGVIRLFLASAALLII